jgi:hypothetical protein
MKESKQEREINQRQNESNEEWRNKETNKQRTQEKEALS